MLVCSAYDVVEKRTSGRLIETGHISLIVLILICFFGCDSHDDSSVIPKNQTIEYDVRYMQNEVDSSLGRYTISCSSFDDVYKVTEQSEFTVNAMSDSMLVDNNKEYEYNSDGKMMSFTETEKNNDVDMYYMRSVMRYGDDIVTVSTSERRVDTEGGSGISEDIEKILPLNLDIAMHNSEMLNTYYDRVREFAIGEYWFTVDMYGYVEHYKYEKNEIVSNDVLGQVNCKKIVREADTLTEYWLNDDNQIVEMKQIMPNDFVVMYSLSSVA